VVCIPPDSEAGIDPVPDIVHGYHALHGGIAARHIAERHRRTLIVSLGGTDLWRLMNGLERADEVAKVLRSAGCITGAFDSFGEICRELLGDIKYVTVPRSVKIPDNDPVEPNQDTLRVVLPPLLPFSRSGRRYFISDNFKALLITLSRYAKKSWISTDSYKKWLLIKHYL